MKRGKYKQLLDLTLKLLISHGELTSAAYNRDPGYNDNSLGMKTERDTIAILNWLEPNWMEKIKEIEKCGS